MKHIYGILDFPITLFCSKDVLGNSFEITIGGQRGLLELPFLPLWEEKQKNPLDMNLRPPKRAEKWMMGNKPIYWGRPNSYPSGRSQVEKVLLYFEYEDSSNEVEIGNKIIKAFPAWLELFNCYIELVSKQNITIDRTIRKITDRLDLFFFDADGKNTRASDYSEPISVCISSIDISLKTAQLLKACELCSSGKRPSIEYRIMLEAYHAYESDDYRKSILESATAVEICLTNRIKQEFSRIDLPFGDKLLNKFRMLGGRFDLIRLLEIELPDIDYQKTLIDPRNDVIHKAHFPDASVALKALETAELLLAIFSPNLEEKSSDL